MPVPTSIDSLSETPSSNSPQGSEPVGTNANEYFQAAFAFIRQIYDGAVKPLAALNFNGQKVTGLAKGAVSTTSTDAINGSQIYVPGEVRYWWGTATEAAVVAAWPTGWHLANGLNGTPNLLDKFIAGAGGTYAIGASGGANTVNLSIAQLPSHNHAVTDNGHSHGININDPGHGHGLNDPGHSHTIFGGTQNYVTGGDGQFQLGSSGTGFRFSNRNDGSATGITIAGAGTGISASSNGSITGVSTQNTGTGAAVENRPPFVAVVPIYYTGA